MRNGLILPLIALILMLTACGGNEVKLQLDNPRPGTVLDTRQIQISGKASNLRETYFFYQIEDGHSFIGEGKLTVDREGRFDLVAEVKTPSNANATISFYLDEDHNGEFDVETDTEQKIGSVGLVFDESLVQR